MRCLYSLTHLIINISTLFYHKFLSY